MGRKNSKKEGIPADKRLKTLSGIGLSTNQRQLAKALQTLNELPIEDAISVLGTKRWQLKESVEHLWSQCGCEVELEIKAGTCRKLQCMSLAKTLNMMVRKFPEFQKKLLELWTRKPCTQSEPYNLLIYGDELVPGNVLHLEQTRKVFGCQGCIKDFGPAFIKSNASRIPLFCIRHDVAQTTPGGMSYIFRMYLRHLFLVEQISDRGIVVPLRTEAGNNVVLYFKLSNLICDGDAIRMIMNWKGARAKLPCFCCMYALSQESEDNLPDGCVTLNCRGKSRFVESTNEDWWGKADTLVGQKRVVGTSNFLIGDSMRTQPEWTWPSVG